MPWEPLPDREREPTLMRDALDAVMNQLSGASLSTIEVVMDSWIDIVGATVAAASTPVKVDGGRLTVRVDDAIWSTEIRWLESTILERIAALAGGASLTGLRVVVGRPR